MEEPCKEDGNRFFNLKLAFSVAAHSLLTSCPREEFMGYLPFLKPSQQDALFQLYTQMAISVQENLEGEFSDICEETRVADALDDEAYLLQKMDSAKVRKRVTTCGRKMIITEKMNELEYLKGTLKMLKEQNQTSLSRLKSLKAEIEAAETQASTDAVMTKLKVLNAKLGSAVSRHKS